MTDITREEGVEMNEKEQLINDVVIQMKLKKLKLMKEVQAMDDDEKIQKYI